MTTENGDVFAELKKSRNKSEKFIPILDDFFSQFDKHLQMSNLEDIVEEKEVVIKIVDQLNTHSKDSLSMFFIPMNLRRLLQTSKEYNLTLLRNESLAFLEWNIKFHLFFHSKAGEDTSSLKLKNTLMKLDDTVCGILDLVAINDITAFGTLVQNYLKLITQIVDAVNKERNCIEELQFTEFTHFTTEAKAMSANTLIPKSDILLKLDSVKELESLFAAVRNVLKRIKEAFTLHLELSPDRKLGSQFLLELLNKAYTARNIKVKIECLDIYISCVCSNTLEYFSNQSFLSLFSWFTKVFLKCSENDEVYAVESILTKGWKCLLEKLNYGVDDATVVVNIATFITRNVCESTIQNWKNSLFQNIIPNVLRNFVQFGISHKPYTDRYLFNYIFEFFYANCKMMDFTSPWISFVIGLIVEEFTSSGSQRVGTLHLAASLKSPETSKSDNSMEEIDEELSSPEDEEVEDEDESDEESLEDVADSYFIQNIWKHFASVKETISKEDVHIFIILCEVINHLRFRRRSRSIFNYVDLKRISDFAKNCCEPFSEYRGDELTHKLVILSTFAKFNRIVLADTKHKLNSSFICKSLLEPWKESVKSRSVQIELLEAFDLSLNGLVYFGDHIRWNEKIELFILKCEQYNSNCDILIDVFPLYWRLLDQKTTIEAFAKMSPKLLPRILGYCCCIAAGHRARPQWTRNNMFKILSQSTSCDVCNGTSTNISVIKSSILQDELISRFLSVMKAEDETSLLSLLNFSAIAFFNHVATDNLSVIDAFLATFSRDVSETTVHKVIASFVKRFSCDECYSSLLLCFKRRFGSDCNTLTKLRWSEISHIVEFGSLVEGELLVEVLVYLVRRCFEKTYIKTEIERLAQMKKLAIEELFKRCQPSLSVKITDLLTSNYSESGGDYINIYILSFSSTATERSANQVSKRLPGHLISYLIMQLDKKGLPLLKSVVPSDVIIEDDYSPLIHGYWLDIVKVIVNNIPAEEIDSALEYLQALCKAKTLEDIFVKHSFETNTYLFCHFHSHHDAAINLLSKLYMYENKSQKSKVQRLKTFNEQRFNEYFVTNMRPFFSYLNRMLMNTEYSVDDNIEAFSSLVDILESLEKDQITVIEIPYKASLRSVFEYWKKHNSGWTKSLSTNFIHVIIDNWRTYIKRHPSLHSQVIEICNVLVPFLEINVDAASQLFNSIIVERASQFSDHFVDLHFLPKNIPEMDSVYSTIKQHLDKLEKNRDSLENHIEQAIRNIASDNPEVKVHHLRELLNRLRDNRRSLQELRVPRKDESSNHLLRKLLKTLLDSCIPYEDLHLHIAECLGEIGAIDPGRLDLVNCEDDNKTTKDIPFSLNDPKFPVMLISELASILDDKPESKIHDCVYYAIQEVLKISKIHRNSAIWTKLDEPLKNICSSLFSSNYGVQYDFESISASMKSPIYNTDLDYKDWIFKWTVKLTTIISNTEPRLLFTSCLAAVKHSCSFARFLLPFVLLFALIESEDDNKNTWIIGEIEAIMKLSSGTPFGSTYPYPMTSPMESKLSISTTQLIEVQHLCVQTIFSVLDSLDNWMYSINMLLKPRKDVEQRNAEHGNRIVSAVESLSKGLLNSDLSDLAFSCQSYARALRYMESHMRHSVTNMSHWETMQKYYAALDDADGVEGVTVKMGHSPSLMDAILAHEVKGQFQDVLSCCEKGIKVEPGNIDYVKIQIRCLMNLDSAELASKVALGHISNRNEWRSDLYPYMIEAAWKLSSWSDLESLLKHDCCRNSETTLNVGIGKLFNFSLRKDEVSFNETLKQLRTKEMNPIAAASMESGAYIRGYSHLVRLHMLNDIEYGLRPLFVREDQRDMTGVLQEWRNRNSVVQSSLWYLQSIVHLQRIIIQIDGKDTDQCVAENAKSLLLSAKIARKSGHMQRAYNYIIEAERATEPHGIPVSLRSQLIIERSKYHWAKGEQESAVTHLQKGLNAHFSSFGDYHSVDTNNAIMKVKLLYATYADQTSSLQSQDLIKLYTDITKSLPNSEDNYNLEEPHFRLAKYYDKLFPTIVDDKEKATNMTLIIKSFRESLRYGAKHVNESVPRMLTVWFELGSLAVAESKKTRPCQEACNSLSSEVFDRLLTDTQPYYYMTCFPQLLSRICHPYEKIRLSLIKLISRLMAQYPKQTFWMLVGTLNNPTGGGGNFRKSLCEQILNDASKANPSLKEYFNEARQLSQLFIELCNCSDNFIMIPKIKALLKLANSKEETKFLLPYQRLMNVRLPSKLSYTSTRKFTEFAEHVYIFTMSDTVEVLQSLQKPKKITLCGSDGRNYVMICKPKDDLRKDQRTMEFMNLVNFHLKKDAETRKRQLSIRTYTVVPLNHECGLVEWVNDLKPVRQIIHELYEVSGVDLSQLKKFYQPTSTSPQERIKKFKQIMKHIFEPPVFSKFFIRNFTDPTAWYLARLAYVRSCAVMSIVGYIIGLGDRHLENILINVVTGSLVHVDFNVLFNKGELLNVPELVPFRLTHNMVDAMGATGYEGAFRITCETTLRVMREQIDALMSVLKPFVYDPLLELQAKDNNTGQKQRGLGSSKKNRDNIKQMSQYEVIPPQALKCVTDIEDRLKGLPRHNDKQMGRAPISVGGQVSYLIEEATNVQNLGQMYIGWAAYF